MMAIFEKVFCSSFQNSNYGVADNKMLALCESYESFWKAPANYLQCFIVRVWKLALNLSLCLCLHIPFVSLYIMWNASHYFEVRHKSYLFLKENNWDSLFSQGVIRLTRMTHPLHQTNCPFSQLCHGGICKNPWDIQDKHRLLIPASPVSLISLLIKTLVWLNWLGPIQSSSSILLKPKLLVSVMRQASKARGGIFCDSSCPLSPYCSSNSTIFWEWNIWMIKGIWWRAVSCSCNLPDDGLGVCPVILP